MTLALAHSFIRSGGRYDHAQSIKNYISWYKWGHFSSDRQTWDLGRSTREALTIWDQEWRSKGCQPQLLDSTQEIINSKLGANSLSSNGKRMGSGNGSLMRIAPVGVALYNNIPLAKQVARKQSMITHPSKICMEACEAYTYLICRVMQGIPLYSSGAPVLETNSSSGQSKDELCHAISTFRFESSELKGRLTRYRTIQEWKNIPADRIKSSGKVDDTIETALWGFFKYDSWEKGALAVVNRGGDSDTAGAIYGSLAGAFYGHREIPGRFTSNMKNWKFISDIAHHFAETLSPSPGGQVFQQRPAPRAKGFRKTFRGKLQEIFRRWRR